MESTKRPKRSRKVLRDSIQGVTNPAIRRIARRGGVKRMSGLVYDATRVTIKNWLTDVIGGAVLYSDHAHRKTVTTMDVIYALKCNGLTMYGYGYDMSRQHNNSKSKKASSATEKDAKKMKTSPEKEEQAKEDMTTEQKEEAATENAKKLKGKGKFIEIEDDSDPGDKESSATKIHKDAKLSEFAGITARNINHLFTQLVSSPIVDVSGNMTSYGAKVMFTASGIDINIHDLCLLNSGEWLNDSIMDAYVVYLRKSNQPHPNIMPDTVYAEILTMKSMITASTTEKSKKQIKKTWEKLLKVSNTNSESVNRIYFPVNVGNHWILAEIDIKTETIRIYDSKDQRNDKKATLLDTFCLEYDDFSQQKLINFTKSIDILKDLQWNAQYNPPTIKGIQSTEVPQQRLNSDCGVYVLYNMDLLSTHQPLNYNIIDIKQYRMTIKKALLEDYMQGEHYVIPPFHTKSK